MQGFKVRRAVSEIAISRFANIYSLQRIIENKVNDFIQQEWKLV